MIGDDKLFVVILVMFIIFVGLGVYLFTLDRKLTRIEKKQKEISNQQKI
jgi:CcmD family protein